VTVTWRQHDSLDGKSRFFSRAHLMNNWSGSGQHEKRPICADEACFATHNVTSAANRPVFQPASAAATDRMLCNRPTRPRDDHLDRKSDQDTINMRARANVEWVVNRTLINIQQMLATVIRFSIRRRSLYAYCTTLRYILRLNNS